MQVQVLVQFKRLAETDWEEMRALAKSLTNEPESVHVSAGSEPDWLVVEFTMPTEPQYKALPKIESAIKCYYASTWRDVRFGFPSTRAERDRAERKAARRKARRAAQRNNG
jgi:hypothetical protein